MPRGPERDDLRDLTALIVHHRTPELLTAAVDALRGAGGPPVLVVHVPAHPDDAAPRLAGVRTLSLPDNPGYAAAVDRGLEAVGTGAVLVMNADVRLPRSTARALLSALRTIPGAGAVGPRILVGEGEATRPDPCAARDDPRLRDRLAFHLGLRPADPPERAAGLPDAPSAVGALSGAAFVMDTAVLRELGGLDPAFRFYGEDLDLFRRLRDRGLRVVHGVGTAHHVGGASGHGREATLLHRLLDADRLWFTRHAGRWSGRAVRATAVLGAALSPVAATLDLLRGRGGAAARRRLLRGGVRLGFGLRGGLSDATLERLDRRLAAP